MAEPSAKSFLDFLGRSGIVAEDTLKAALRELSKKFQGKVIKYDDLTTHLIDADLITSWHVEKLQAGKYKGFFLGKYKLLGHLGTGGMSAVYLAQHKISGHRRAIKVLPRKKVSDKSYLDRFYREGKAAASLNHPNIVRIYDIANDNNTHYMVMEFVKGQDLYELVKSDGPLDFQTAAQYIAEAAIGLEHAHRRKLVHRDIKPANLLLADDGQIKILDLGLALMREDDEESLTLLHNERVMGTADYLSPEQAVNSHNVDHRADIYSLGCTLYFLISGKPPFPTGSLAQRIAKHQSEYPEDLREIRPETPSALVTLCNQMIRKKPDERFQNCRDVESAMKEFVKTGETSVVDMRAAEMRLEAKQLRKSEKSQRFASIPEVGNANSATGIVIETATPPSKSSKSKKRLLGSFKSGKNVVPTPSFASRPKLPIWALVSIITLLFVALTLMLLIANRLVNGQDQTTRLHSPAICLKLWKPAETENHSIYSPRSTRPV